MLKRLTLAGLWLALAGCEAEQALTLEQLSPTESWPEAEARTVSLRRLTRAQYTNVVEDLFGDGVVVPLIAEPDVKSAGLVALGGASSTYSPRGVESLEAASYQLVDQVMASDELRGALVGCMPAGIQDDACARETLQRFGRRAWRRGLSSEELDRLVGLATSSASTLGDFHEGLGFAVAAVLQSPHFLFRTELGDGSGKAFSGIEMASRLSFFLWNTAPDEALLDAAEAGELDTDEGLFTWASRMLDDERSRRGMRAFFVDHLQLDVLESKKKDPTLFEHYSPELMADAKEETLRLLEYVSLDAAVDYRSVMTTRETFVNPRLASLYGIPAPSDDWARVEHPWGGRSGLLGHASLLSLHSHAISSSATLRGKAVRTTLLCELIPPPPVDVDTSIPEPSGTARTLRERVAEHLENPACSACHRKTDPIGLGLENFDAIGQWRSTDNDTLIDPRGHVDGFAFDNPAGLGAAVGAQTRFTDCFVRTMARYATGVHEDEEHDPWLDLLFERFGHHGYEVRPLMLELILSPVFRRAGGAP